MRKYFSLFIVLSLFFVMACNSTSAKKNHDGTYNFDTTLWLDAMKKVDPKFDSGPADMITKMTSAFQAFNFIVKGDKATANFGSMVVEGTLTDMNKTSDGLAYKMTPTDPAKKDQPISLLFKDGGVLIAGPKDKKNEWLYFKKK